MLRDQQKGEDSMLIFFGMLVAVLWVANVIFTAPAKVKETVYREETCCSAALSSKVCFEEDDEYPFLKGLRTPKSEFYRRLELFKAQGGVVNQHICDRIADDISSEVKSMRGRRTDRDSEKIF